MGSPMHDHRLGSDCVSYIWKQLCHNHRQTLDQPKEVNDKKAKMLLFSFDQQILHSPARNLIPQQRAHTAGLRLNPSV